MIIDPIELEFTGTKDFEAYYAAEKWCKDHDISIGSMCREAPVGLKKGDYIIAKWYYLSAKDAELLDGKIVGEDKRSGPVKILLNKSVYEEVTK